MAHSLKHHLTRTSPYGTPFVGTCLLCGREGLPASAALYECENVASLSAEEALMMAIEGGEREALAIMEGRRND